MRECISIHVGQVNILILSVELILKNPRIMTTNGKLSKSLPPARPSNLLNFRYDVLEIIQLRFPPQSIIRASLLRKVMTEIFMSLMR